MFNAVSKIGTSDILETSDVPILDIEWIFFFELGGKGTLFFFGKRFTRYFTHD